MDLREMELRDTVEMMNSADYKERFKAEYYQTAIRYGKLKAMVDKYNNGTLEFKPTCPMSIYDIQLRAMRDYLTILEARAAIEGVELDGKRSGKAIHRSSRYEWIL